MGRLSDARKKAKAAQGNTEGQGPAILQQPPETIAPAASAPKSAPPQTPSLEAPPVQQREITVVESTSEKLDAKPKGLPASGLAEDLLAAWEAEGKRTPSKTKPVSKPPESRGLPASGLADELLASYADSLPAAPQKRGLPSSGLAEDLLATLPSLDGPSSIKVERTFEEDILDVLKDSSDDSFSVRGLSPAVLPSSGLADDILKEHVAPKRNESKSGLRIDEIHEFESFFEEERGAEQIQLVLFHMDEESFALEIDRVQEIIRVPAITRVPHAAEHVRGVCNLRGRIVPVLDLRRLMKLPTRLMDRSSRVMVLDITGKRIGVLIDRVSEVARINVPDVEPPPEEMRSIDSNLVTAVARYGERMVFILDVDRVLALK